MTLGELRLPIVLQMFNALDSTKKLTGNLKSLEDQSKKTASVTANLQSKMQNAGLTFMGLQSIVSTLKGTLGQFINQFNSFQAAAKGLESISLFKGIDPEAAGSAVKSLEAVRSGLMSLADASTATKNLLAANFTLEQSVEIIDRLSNSAAFGRQASLSFGDAVRSATEGIKNGNSILVDNAGVTKNLSVMLEQAGYKAQDMMRAGEDAGVRMAILNGILTETQGQVGDVEKLMGTGAGAAAQFQKSMGDLQIAFGEMLSAYLLPILKPLTGFLQSLSTAPGNIKTAALAVTILSTAFIFLNGAIPATVKIIALLAAGIIALPEHLRLVVAGILTVTGAAYALSVAFGVLGVASGGITIAIGALVTGLSGVISYFAATSDSAEDLTADVMKLRDEVSQSKSNLEQLKGLGESIGLGVADNEKSLELSATLKDLSQIYPDIITGVNAYTGELQTNANVIQSVIDRETELLKIRNDALVYKIAGGIKELTDEYSGQIEVSQDLSTENKQLKQELEELEKANKQLISGLDSTAVASGQLTNEQAQLHTQIKSNDERIKYLTKQMNDNASQMLDGVNAAAQLKQQLVDLISAGLRTGNLTDVFNTLTMSLGSSSQAATTLQGVFANLSSNAIANLLGISSSAQNMGQVLWAIAKGQAFLTQGNFSAAEAMFNIAKGIQGSAPGSGTTNTKTSGTGKQKSSRAPTGDKEEELNEEKRLLTEIAEIEKKIAANTGNVGALKDLNEELRELRNELQYVRTGIEVIDFAEQLEGVSRSRDDLISGMKEAADRYVDENKKAIEEVDRLKIESINDETKRKRAQLQLERRLAIEEINSRNIDPAIKKELMSLTNRKFNQKDPNESANKTEQLISESLSFASQISSVLGIGAESFVGKLLSGLQQGLSLANSFASLLSAILNISGGGGLFSLLGFAGGGSVPGTGSGDTVPAMLTPGEFVVKKAVVNKIGTGFFEWLNGGGLFSSIAGKYASGGLVTQQAGSQPQVYIINSKVRGNDLDLVLKRTNKINSRRIT